MNNFNNHYDNKFIEKSKQFAISEIQPYAKEFEKNEALPQALIGKMGLQGFLTPLLPAQYGGCQLDPITYGIFIEEISKACNSTRALITVQDSLVGVNILQWGSQEQKKRYLPLLSTGKIISAFALSEPNAGSDARNLTTTYEKIGNRFIINGHKKWITMGSIADLFLVIARNSNAITAFLVDGRCPGITIKSIKNLWGNKAAHLAEVIFENVEVLDNSILGQEGFGFDSVVSMALDYGRYSIAWAAIGIAQASLSAMINYARKREQFGQKIHNFQLIRGMIANSVTKVNAARALCLQAGEARKSMSEYSMFNTIIAKNFSASIASEVANTAIQIHGGNGISEDFPVERLYREARILNIIEGTEQINQNIIAEIALNEYFDKDMSA